MAEERKRILWADDEIDHLRPHMKFLEDRGFQVDGVTNGEDAIAMTEESREPVRPGDPGRDDARASAASRPCRESRKLLPYVPIIMVTKSEDEELIDAAIRKEIQNYLVKPVNPLQVYTAAKQLMDGARIRESGVMRDYVERVHGSAESAHRTNSSPEIVDRGLPQARRSGTSAWTVTGTPVCFRRTRMPSSKRTWSFAAS